MYSYYKKSRLRRNYKKINKSVTIAFYQESMILYEINSIRYSIGLALRIFETSGDYYHDGERFIKSPAYPMIMFLLDVDVLLMLITNDNCLN